ncbi:fasciclin domain-containing protein [Sphingomonas rubra]|uniref:Uncaracterized surface protein containing fasciclin (FAS1) repeats n=1 Tax=Sphingomonas rubra TaxID=634430 RepID=A0A1I5QQ10_9SPHN|nr:fasciclin domain-containing protein [Sphingomonas rubra]SFP48091.1 Uncaracterized surface protein containing fasciclin (FAS1) repeats [Sphingomonas rubra]
MMRALPFALVLLAAGCVAPPVAVVPPPVVIAPEQRNLRQEIAATPTLSRFAAALAASGDARTAGSAAITVFATSDDAYARLAPGVAEALVAPENRDTLGRFVAYHLVEGRVDGAELRRRVAAGGGRALLPTLAGEPLAVTLTGDVVTLTDGDGDRAYLRTAESVRPNGVLHVVDGFLAPAMP